MPFLAIVLFSVAGLLIFFAAPASSDIGTAESSSWFDSWRPPGPLPKGSRPAATLAACYAFAPLYAIEPRWIFFTAYLESKFVPSAIGDHGASFGLTQLQKNSVETLLEDGKTVSDDWQFGVAGNIQTACQYAAWLIRNYDIQSAGMFREVWVNGPTGYFVEGRRSPNEARNLETLLA